MSEDEDKNEGKSFFFFFLFFLFCLFFILYKLYEIHQTFMIGIFFITIKNNVLFIFTVNV